VAMTVPVAATPVRTEISWELDDFENVSNTDQVAAVADRLGVSEDDVESIHYNVEVGLVLDANISQADAVLAISEAAQVQADMVHVESSEEAVNASIKTDDGGSVGTIAMNVQNTSLINKALASKGVSAAVTGVADPPRAYATVVMVVPVECGTSEADLVLPDGLTATVMEEIPACSEPVEENKEDSGMTLVLIGLICGLAFVLGGLCVIVLCIYMLMRNPKIHPMTADEPPPPSSGKSGQLEHSETPGSLLPRHFTISTMYAERNGRDAAKIATHVQSWLEERNHTVYNPNEKSRPGTWVQRFQHELTMSRSSGGCALLLADEHSVVALSSHQQAEYNMAVQWNVDVHIIKTGPEDNEGLSHDVLLKLNQIAPSLGTTKEIERLDSEQSRTTTA